MPTASAIRLQIESALARKIPTALTPAPKIIRPVVPTGVSEVDTLLEGGLPVGAITEIVGAESCGRTVIALSLMRHLTHAERVCAWGDVSDRLSRQNPERRRVSILRVRFGHDAGCRNRMRGHPPNTSSHCPRSIWFPRPSRKVCMAVVAADTRSKFLLVEGPLQNHDNVIHVKATRLTTLSGRALEVRSYD